LKKRAEKDDSAKLILGDYYSNNFSYSKAEAILSKANLPAAKSIIGKMYYNNFLGTDTTYGKQYFEAALQAGPDTTANYYLGLIALKKLQQQQPLFRRLLQRLERCRKIFFTGILQRLHSMQRFS